MKLNQLSVFLENKSGRLTEVANLLGREGINLIAMAIADNSDFGTLRCIVSDAVKAREVLKNAHFAVKRTQVVAFTCENRPGRLAQVLGKLSEAGIFIEYMYSFAWGEKASVVIRPSDMEAAEELLLGMEGVGKVDVDSF